ncbi:kelch repeat-containing protein [Flammeovirga sp. SubArs3]|uniref:Kelch repeat-containing protein n=1 Tax=Flammeovirga sp. SubArs3 TaxID=2995316 RepID=UPI00248BE2E3|nr:kelch repeat-containing protein [Flammeovirga sp. SubArs3]
MQLFRSLLLSVTILIIISCQKEATNIPGDGIEEEEILNQPPYSFQLVEIQDSATNVTINPRFIWQQSTDPDQDPVSYSFYIEEGSDNPSNLYHENFDSTTFTIVDPLKRDTQYSWKVVASDIHGASTESSIFSFTTYRNYQPEKFNLISPYNNEDEIPFLPLLKWESAIDPDGDAISYQLKVTNTETNEVVVDIDNYMDTTFQISDELVMYTKYDWQVIAKDSYNDTTHSANHTFYSKRISENMVLRVGTAPFIRRDGHSSVVFNGKIYIFGGSNTSGVNNGIQNDVWSSNDGKNWTEVEHVNSPTSFTSRHQHTTVAFKNKLWTIGGGTADGIKNDVWSSSDGKNWTLEVENAPFDPRYTHTCLVYNDKIWIIGGRLENSHYLNDIWSSVDGINWVCETKNADFDPRGYHTSVVFKDKMWVMGGYKSGLGSGSNNEVWSSVDGKNWIKETQNAEWSKRTGLSSVVFDGKMWVTSGGYNNDLWSTEDGIKWKQQRSYGEMHKRSNQTAVTFDNKIFIIGGWRGDLLNDVWCFY